MGLPPEGPPPPALMPLSGSPDDRELSWMFGNLSSMALAGGLKLAPPGLDSDLAIASAEVSTAWLPKGFTSYELFQRMIERATDFSWLKSGDRAWSRFR